MFGFGETTSVKKEQGRSSSPRTALPTLVHFSDLNLEGIKDNASLTAAFGVFVKSFTSQDPTVQNIKTVFTSLQNAFPELSNPSFQIKNLLEACIQKLAQYPLYAFPHTEITDENQEDLAKYAEILAILHYVLTNQIQVNLGNFLGRMATGVVNGLLAVQRVAHQLQNKPKIGSIEEELDEIAGLLMQWQKTLNEKLFRHEQRKLLKVSEAALLEKINGLSIETGDDEISALFSGIDDLKEKIELFSDAKNQIKVIEQNTFLITALEALLNKYKTLGLASDSEFGKQLIMLMGAMNESNALMKSSIKKITESDGDDGLCDEDEEFFQAYTRYFRALLSKKLLSQNTLTFELPESSNNSPMTYVVDSFNEDKSASLDDEIKTEDDDVFFDADNAESPVLTRMDDNGSEEHKSRLTLALEELTAMQRLHEHKKKLKHLHDEMQRLARERVLQEAKRNLKPIPTKPIVNEERAEFQADHLALEIIPDDDEFIATIDAHITLNTPLHREQPTPTAATTRPFLNARRTTEVMTSSLCLLYAGGVGLESLGQLSLVSVIQPFFVAATFASPAAIIALAACALVLLICMAEMAYTYHQNTQATRQVVPR